MSRAIVILFSRNASRRRPLPDLVHGSPRKMRSAGVLQAYPRRARRRPPWRNEDLSAHSHASGPAGPQQRQSPSRDLHQIDGQRSLLFSANVDRCPGKRRHPHDAGTICPRMVPFRHTHVRKTRRCRDSSFKLHQSACQQSKEILVGEKYALPRIAHDRHGGAAFRGCPLTQVGQLSIALIAHGLAQCVVLDLQLVEHRNGRETPVPAAAIPRAPCEP